jgi:SIR2-like protein
MRVGGGGVNWDRLERAYEESGIVLALGAGVSMTSRIPKWTDLLDGLARAVMDGEGEDFFRGLIDRGVSLPVMASLLEERCSGREEFIERVREVLYRDFPFFPNGIPKPEAEQFVRHIKETNPTLHAIGSLCAIRDERTAMYRTNPRVASIVTFNLDSLLQAYTRRRFGTRLLRTIERASASSDRERICVYHMHGFLRFDKKARDRTKEAPDAVVLTEQDYFDFFNNPTSLFNYTFLYLLREYPCLFVGLSMQDENIRRLLHYSKMERVRGFLNEGLGVDEARKKSLRHFAILHRTGAKHADRSVEQSLRQLGTEVLWIADYGEIPERIRGMYESAGEDWSLVA